MATGANVKHKTTSKWACLTCSRAGRAQEGTRGESFILAGWSQHLPPDPGGGTRTLSRRKEGEGQEGEGREEEKGQKGRNEDRRRKGRQYSHVFITLSL